MPAGSGQFTPPGISSYSAWPWALHRQGRADSPSQRALNEAGASKDRHIASSRPGSTPILQAYSAKAYLPTQPLPPLPAPPHPTSALTCCGSRPWRAAAALASTTPAAQAPGAQAPACQRPTAAGGMCTGRTKPARSAHSRCVCSASCTPTDGTRTRGLVTPAGNSCALTPAGTSCACLLPGPPQVDGRGAWRIRRQLIYRLPPSSQGVGHCCLLLLAKSLDGARQQELGAPPLLGCTQVEEVGWGGSVRRALQRRPLLQS